MMGAEANAAACEVRCSSASFRPGRNAPPLVSSEAQLRSVCTSGSPRPVPGGRGARLRPETQVVVGEIFSPQGLWPQLLTGSG